MRSQSYQSVGDTHITVPSSFQLSDGRRFVQTKVFAKTGNQRPTILGEIHDPVAGPIAHVNTHTHLGKQIIAVDTISQNRYWGRIYDPAQTVEEQIHMVAIIALYGEELS
jgi:hypothetical protein